MENGFIVLYAKDGVAYPVCCSEDQHTLLQLMIGSVLEHKVRVDENNPIGRPEEWARKSMENIEQIRMKRHCLMEI